MEGPAPSLIQRTQPAPSCSAQHTAATHSVQRNVHLEAKARLTFVMTVVLPHSRPRRHLPQARSVVGRGYTRRESERLHRGETVVARIVRRRHMGTDN